MAKKQKVLSEEGFRHFWDILSQRLRLKVDAVDGKQLSTNDYTNEEKAKLAGIADEATKNTVENVLTSDSEVNALSAKQGKILNQSVAEQQEEIDTIQDTLNEIPQGKPIDTDTASGTIITIENAAGMPAIDCITTLEPIQDLNGYDHPWPAGGGKNKALLNSDTIQKPSWYTGGWDGISLNSKNGITQTRSYSQGGAGGFHLSLPPGEYVISLTPSLNQRCRLFVACIDSNGNKTTIVNNLDMTEVGNRRYYAFEVPDGAVDVAIRPTVFSTSEIYDLDDIMIEIGSTATAFVPYSNICPITGHTGATLAQARAIADPADWDWMGVDEDVPVDTSIAHVLTVGAKNIVSYGKIPFDPQQYLFAVTAESLAWLGISGTALPAGTYNVTLDHGAYSGGTVEDGTFQFTTTQPVPVGGGIRHSYMGTFQSSNAGYGKAKVLAGTFTTYDADRTTVIEEGLATTEGSEGTSLGTTTASNPSYKVGDYINFTQRQKYGSNRWSTSFMRQYLNSDEETMTFTPATIWSRPMATLPEGFLHTLDPELKAVLCKVRTRYALPIADGYGYEDIEDLVKLDTMLDIFGSQNNSIAEGPVDADGNVTRRTAYSMWKPLNANADRIKYQGTTARTWWLASTSPSYANYERVVNASGALSSGSAYDTSGVVPRLHIALDDLHTAAFVDGEGDPLTVYGGTLDWQKGTLTVRPYYSSYNGEALMGRWISSMDVYADGTTPTNGAQVVDLDGAGTTYQLTPQQIRLLRGENALRSADGSTELTYYVDDIIMTQGRLGGLSFEIIPETKGLRLRLGSNE